MVDPTPPSPCSNKVPGGPARRAGSSPASPLPSPRIALAHDWIVALRGGERVLAAIADALPHPPHHLYTLFHNHTPITPAIDATAHTASVLNHAPQSLRRWLLPAYPAAVAQLARRLAADHQREPIDLLISTSSVAIKALGPPTGVPHLCYCHTPARYLWTQTDAYATADATGRLRAAGLALFKSRLQRWDKRTSSHVTAFIANSTHTQRLIRDAYDRDSTVIHPPVRTDFFTPDASVPRENFLLMVSALEPYKRVDLAIEAATLAGRPLIIIGTGSHEPALRALARDRPAITFLGRAPDDTVRDHMRRAHAFLMPQIEDFGITAVEAQACGTPVIATAAGGALDTVLDGPTDTRTGVLVHDPGPHAFAHALDRLPLQPDAACRANALRFSPDRFRTQLLKIITRHLPA